MNPISKQETKPPMMTIRNLVHQYNGETVLSVDNLSLRPGSTTGLIGPNGSGKSTLLNILACAQPPTTGEVCFNQIPIKPFSSKIRNRVSLLPQESYLLKRSVFDNVAFGLRIRKDTARLKQRVCRALEWVGLSPSLFSRRYWHELSGGETRRVALAARLILKPEVLVLDEPITGIDAESAGKIREAICRAGQKWGTTLVIAGHDRDWLYSICDDIIHMYQGRILGHGFQNILIGFFKKVESSLHPSPRAITSHQQARVPVVDTKGMHLNAFDSKTGIHADFRNNVYYMNGVIYDMSKGHDDQNILVRATAGKQMITASVPENRIISGDFYPGKKVQISFKNNDVRWV